MTAEPVIIQRPPQPYVAIKTLVTMQALGRDVPPLNGEVMGWLGQHGVAPAGPPFWKYNVIDMERELEIEAGSPVATALPRDDRVLAGVLPAGRYASVRHIGHPDTLVGAVAALLDWAKAQDLRWDSEETPDGERWGSRLEIYHSDPVVEPDMSKWETELAFRLSDV
jgi:effector-binding domain-containing protein